MKKLFVFALVLCMIFAFSACGEEEASSVQSTTKSEVSSVESKVESKVESAVESKTESKTESKVESKVESVVSTPVDVQVKPNELIEYNDRGSLTRDIVLSSFNQEQFTSSDGTTLLYSIYVPSNYDKSKDYPLVTFLHGAGERGNDNTSQLKNMVWQMYSTETEEMAESIVIAPQCPAGQQWVDTPWANGNYSVDTVQESDELKALTELIKKINKDYSTDSKRQYVIGLSMGGFGTWDLIMRHKDMFTAAVPICGGADTSKASTLTDFPIFTVHGGADPTVPTAGTRDMVNAIKAAGGTKITYTELAGMGHGVWDYTATSTNALQWMFSQTK